MCNQTGVAQSELNLTLDGDACKVESQTDVSEIYEIEDTPQSKTHQKKNRKTKNDAPFGNRTRS
jgi:hypothetical protein